MLLNIEAHVLNVAL